MPCDLVLLLLLPLLLPLLIVILVRYEEVVAEVSHEEIVHLLVANEIEVGVSQPYYGLGLPLLQRRIDLLVAEAAAEEVVADRLMLAIAHLLVLVRQRNPMRVGLRQQVREER